MGKWINLPLFDGGTVRAYETDDDRDRRMFNIDVSDWTYNTAYTTIYVDSQATANLAKNTANAFLNQLKSTSAYIQLHNIIPDGGDVTYVNNDGEPVTTIHYPKTQVLYITAILNGPNSYTYDNGLLISKTSESGYYDYSTVLAAAENPIQRYIAGIKFRVMTSDETGYYGINYISQILGIDDFTYMLGPKGGDLIPFSLIDKEGRVLYLPIGKRPDFTVPEAPYSCNHSIFYVYNDKQRKKKYLRIYPVYFIDRWDEIAGLPVKYGGISSNYALSHDITDASGVEEIPYKEDEYMNELMNRFSPRFHAGSLGTYLIGTGDINDVMQAMMEVDVNSILSQTFFGSDGKEYILGCRWYYGLQKAGGHTQGDVLMTADKFEIKVGNTKLTKNNSPLYAHLAATEFATWTSSELDVPTHFDNYLDFTSTYQLYIPYYGFIDIAANDIVGGSIQLIYNINLVSGIANIVVVCKNSRTGNAKTKYYTVTAKIGIDVPFGSDIMKTLMVNWAQNCGKAFMTGATLGTGMAMANAMENVSQANSALSNIDYNTETGREAANNVTKYRDDAQASVNRSQFTKAVLNDINIKSVDTPHRSGGTNDEAGSLDELHPYLLITRPVSVTPDEYEDYVGVPSAEVKKLSECSGFTQIAAIQPSALSSPPKYINEIISQLQAGVYL